MYLERTALQRTSRGSEPGGGGVSFTDTPQPPPPPGSDPGPLVGRPRNGKRICGAGSCGPTGTAAPERGAIPVAAPWGQTHSGLGRRSRPPHACRRSRAAHPSQRRDWHVPLPWALTGTTRGRHNNRPGRPAGPGPSLRQHPIPYLGLGRSQTVNITQDGRVRGPNSCAPTHRRSVQRLPARAHHNPKASKTSRRRAGSRMCM